MVRYAIACKKTFRSRGLPDWNQLLDGIPELVIETQEPGYRIVISASEEAIQEVSRRMSDTFHIEPIVGFEIEC